MGLEDLIDDEFRELATFGVAENKERLKQRWIDLGLPEDFARSDTMDRIAEAMAKEKNDLALQGAFYAQEAMPTRAHLRTSIIDGFSLFDFQPTRRTRSTVDLDFSLDSTHPTDIKIPRKTVVAHSGDTGATVLTLSDVILPAGSTEVTVEAGEGTLQSKEIVSQGEPNLTVSVPSDIVAEEGLEVYVDGNLWTEVDTLQRALQNSDIYESYEVRTLPDETLEILFGDNLQGKIPAEGATIRIEYIETRGSFRIESSNSITELQSTIFDVTGTDVTDQLSVTNDSRPLDGGSERQREDQIQFLAPQIFQTGQRAVSKPDHEAISIDYESVLTANVIGERQADPGNPDWARRVKVFVVRERDQNGDPLPVDDAFAYGSSGNVRDPERDSLAGELLSVGNPVLVREIEGAELVWFFIRSEIFIDPGVEPSVVRSEVQNILENNLKLSDEPERTIGEPVRNSNVIDLIDNVSQIKHHYTHLITFARANFTQTNQTFGLQDFTTPSTDYHFKPPFQRGEVRLTDLDDNTIAVDDGNGNLEPVSGETNFQSGKVDYNDPEKQDLQSDVASGSSVTVDVEDASVFDVDDRVKFEDDTGTSEVTRVLAVNETNDTIDVDLSNSYSTTDNATVDKLWTLDVTWSSAPNEIYQIEFEGKDPRIGETFRDGDVLVKQNQFPIYRGSINDISFEFTSQ